MLESLFNKFAGLKALLSVNIAKFLRTPFFTKYLTVAAFETCLRLKHVIGLQWWLRQKMKFSFKEFFDKCHQKPSFQRIWSHLMKKSLMENFIFPAVIVTLEDINETFGCFVFKYILDKKNFLPFRKPHIFSFIFNIG